MKKTIMLTVIILFITGLHADTIFPGMYGDSLIDSIIKYYKSYSNQGYDDGRDIMYTEVSNTNDSVYCVYTGYRIYLNHNEQYPRNITNANDIDCEHTWPKNYGAGTGIAESDLHHLYPTWNTVNSSRGNLPFAEINDIDADNWYYNGSTYSTIPSSNIDLYSERDINVAFEPREDHKGNVARSMFYFYTMYKSYYIAVDPGEGWWNGQKDDLFMWHYWDPVDNAEITRTNAIAGYQENKANPFVLDTTLIRRAYYPHLAGIEEEKPSISIVSGLSYIAVDAGNEFIESISIYDMTGRAVFSNHMGEHTMHIDADIIGVSGKYIVYVKTETHDQSAVLMLLH